MASPDAKPYVNLTLFDLTPQKLYDNAVSTLATNLPTWRPREGNTEVLLLESLALMVSEGVFAINRLPSALIEILAKLFGITRDAGGPPTCTLTFTMAGTAGYTIPSGTKARLALSNNRWMVFSTDVDLVIAPGGSTGAVTATGDLYTDEANGVNSVTIALIDSLLAVNSVAITTVVGGGRAAETDLDYFTRAKLRFSRITGVLALPAHFEAKALETPLIYPKAKALDNWTPDTIATPVISTVTNATVGGTLGNGTYTYRVSAINAQGETLASAEVGVVVSSGTGTNKTTVTWTAPAVPSGVSPITGYKVYGRTAGAELLMATLGVVLTWDDNGSVTPAGALPAANTTTQVLGSAPGHITVATYGPNRLNTTQEKADLDLVLEAMALANLDVHVIDPTITTVAVTVSVTIKSGFVAADVITAVTAALNTYLDPNNWAWGTTVYRNELISLIDQVAGVDRVVTLTLPAADTALTGYATLADAGAITVTVV